MLKSTPLIRILVSIFIALLTMSVKLPANVDVNCSTITVYEAREIFNGTKRILRGQFIKVYIPDLHSEKGKELIEAVLQQNYNNFIDKFISNQSVLSGAMPRIISSDSDMISYITENNLPSIGYFKQSMITFFIMENKKLKLLVLR